MFHILKKLFGAKRPDRKSESFFVGLQPGGEVSLSSALIPVVDFDLDEIVTSAKKCREDLLGFISPSNPANPINAWDDLELFGLFTTDINLVLCQA